MSAKLAWVAGLLVGDGHISARIRKSGRHPSIVLVVTMLDERAVKRVARILTPLMPIRTRNTGVTGVTVRSFSKPNYNKVLWEIRLESRPAEQAIKALYPYLKGTDKGDQAEAAFAALGYDILNPELRKEISRYQSEDDKRKIKESMDRHQELLRGKR